jgi:DHA2 family multidrug resistance protein
MVAPGTYPPLSRGKLVWLTAAISTAAFMEVLDTTIVNVAVPHISGSLGVSNAEGTWTISSYMLTAAIMQPLTGWLGRRFGEVRTLTTSVFLFMVFSAVCGLARSLPLLIAARLIQGLVSGPMMSVAQAILLRNYPAERRGVAIATMGMVIVVAPIFGPILGGWITDNLTWPWLFFINLPVGALVITITWMILRRRESTIVRQPIDIVGLVLMLVSVGSLQYLLDTGNDEDWFNSSTIVAAAVVSVIGFAFLIPWELMIAHPVVDLRLFLRRNFRVGVGVIAVGYFALVGINVIFPLWLQTNANYTATWAGLAVAPIGLFAVLAAPIVGRNMNRMNLRLAISFAFCVFGINVLWVASLNESASFSQLAFPRLWQGLGIAFFFLPLNQIVFSNVSPNDLASASGLSNFIRNMAGSCATAITIWIWNRRTDYHHAVLTEHVRHSAIGWTSYQAQLESHGITGTQAYQTVDRVISQQALTLGMSDVFYVFGAMFVLIIPLVWLARPPFSSDGAGATH